MQQQGVIFDTERNDILEGKKHKDAVPELKTEKERETNETVSRIIKPRTVNSKQDNASK